MISRQLISISALLVLVNSHIHQKHESDKKIENKTISSLFKRSGTCSFPTDKGLVAVQKDGENAGWAMHYDQTCSYGSWCPYACPPGQLMGQWDPEVTKYVYPGSQYGGLWCNEDGELEGKISQNSYCYDGKETLVAQNQADSDVAICQTVLPGNEEMLIPTNVQGNGKATLAVPGTEYWAGTAAHYYINPPGVSINDGCKWGSLENPWGNWAPYVAGANQDSNENTYVKIGWNPIYLEDTTPFRNEQPSFGVRITCDDESQCLGLPCSIDPSSDGVNGVSGDSTIGAGGAAFCIVTARNGAKANVEVFNVGSSSNQKRHEHNRENEANLDQVIKTKTIHQTLVI